MRLGLRKYVAVLCFVSFANIFGAEFPADKSVTIVVPFSGGGTTDKIARQLALSMSKSLGQSVVVDNVVGVGGTVGSGKVAAAPKDGYTLLVQTIDIATAPSLYKGLAFDTLQDFDFIGQIVDIPMVVLGSKKLPKVDFLELIHYIRSNPGKVSIGHAGVGSAGFACALLLENETRSKMLFVHYKGSAQVLSDLIEGQIDLACDQATSMADQMKGGLIRAYAVTSPYRSQFFPAVLTTNEHGLPGLDIKTWHGIFAPRGLPPLVRQKLVFALQYAVRDTDFAQKMSSLGGKVAPLIDASPESLKAKLITESALWSKLIQNSEIRPK